MATHFPDVKSVSIGGGYGVKYRQEEQLADLNLLFD